MRRFRGGSRFRRRFSRPGKAPGGRKKHWVSVFFEGLSGQPLANNQFCDLFELVNPFDYGDAGSSTTSQHSRETNYATVVRTVGKLEVDLTVEAPGSNGVLWSACLFVRSSQAVSYEFSATAGQAFFIHPEQVAPGFSGAANLNRLQPMAWMPNRAYSGSFIENTGGICSEFYSHINRPAQSEPWYFDVKQRRRMRTDESLWMLVSGIYVCLIGGEENPIVNTCLARTLLFDD